MKLLLLGAEGQLGRELSQTLATVGQVQPLGRREADFTDFDGLRSVVRAAGANVIVNAAAYTRVERANMEPDLALRVNGEAPRVLATEAARSRALLVHFSTDYVFDGRMRRAYVEDDATAPLNAYGASKLAGDEALLESEAAVLVFRIEWVYSRHGNNFFNRIRELAQQRDELKVVNDQYGCPTWARSVAEATSNAISQWLRSQRGGDALARGLYHMASPDYTTWYEFAKAIVDLSEFPSGKKPPTVRAIATADYGSAIERPSWSVLDSRKLWETFRIKLPPWREQLEACLGMP